MVAKVFKDIEQAAGHYSGLARKVLDYSLTMKRIITKQDGESLSELS